MGKYYLFIYIYYKINKNNKLFIQLILNLLNNIFLCIYLI